MKYRWSKRRQKYVPVKGTFNKQYIALTRQDMANLKHLKAIQRGI